MYDKKDYITEVLAEDEEVLYADGLISAFIGIGRQFGKPIAVYSKNKVIQHFQKEGMTEEEAHEFFSFNVEGAYVGDQTPIFLEDLMHSIVHDPYLR